MVDINKNDTSLGDTRRMDRDRDIENSKGQLKVEAKKRAMLSLSQHQQS